MMGGLHKHEIISRMTSWVVSNMKSILFSEEMHDVVFEFAEDDGDKVRVMRE